MGGLVRRLRGRRRAPPRRARGRRRAHRVHGRSTTSCTSASCAARCPRAPSSCPARGPASGSFARERGLQLAAPRDREVPRRAHRRGDRARGGAAVNARRDRIAGISPPRSAWSPKARRAGAIPLGLGEPGWDIPEPARRALAAASGPVALRPERRARRSCATRSRRATARRATKSSSPPARRSASSRCCTAWSTPATRCSSRIPGSRRTRRSRSSAAAPVPYALDAEDRFRLTRRDLRRGARRRGRGRAPS